MKKKNKQEKPQRSTVVENLSVYTKKIEELDKQCSELNDEVKSLKKSKVLDIIFRVGCQILGSDMIHDSLKDEAEEFIKWANIILSKFQ